MLVYWDSFLSDKLDPIGSDVQHCKSKLR